MRRIRIEVTIDNPIGGTEWEDLPDDWDEIGGKRQREHLDEVAAEWLAEYAGSAASVVDDEAEPVTHE